MLDATPEVVGDRAARSWQFMLKGFWTSGLRLQEACHLYWDSDKGHSVDFTGRRPMFAIRGALEKSNRDRLLPMAPEFAHLLEQVAEEARRGRVFQPQPKRPGGRTPQQHRVGENIAAIGEAAGVVVDANPVTGEPTKFASAHDLRRAFGHR